MGLNFLSRQTCNRLHELWSEICEVSMSQKMNYKPCVSIWTWSDLVSKPSSSRVCYPGNVELTTTRSKCLTYTCTALKADARTNDSHESDYHSSLCKLHSISLKLKLKFVYWITVINVKMWRNSLLVELSDCACDPCSVLNIDKVV